MIDIINVCMYQTINKRILLLFPGNKNKRGKFSRSIGPLGCFWLGHSGYFWLIWALKNIFLGQAWASSEYLWGWAFTTLQCGIVRLPRSLAQCLFYSGFLYPYLDRASLPIRASPFRGRDFNWVLILNWPPSRLRTLEKCLNGELDFTLFYN